MSLINIIALLTTLAAIFSYVNHRLIKLPTTIGLMLITLLMSLGLILSGTLGLGLEAEAKQIIAQIDFSQTLMHGMLSFLLFAGALHVNLGNLLQQKWVIGICATVGILCSTFLVGTAMFYLLGWLGLALPFIACLTFGALISPTDPIAVLGLLKQANAPKSLETKIAGESLFIDGVGVVIFLVLLELFTGAHPFAWGHVGKLLALEALGGIVLGLVLGGITHYMLKSIDNYHVEVLLTLALVTGGYALAMALHTSGPLAIVVAGLFIGNQGRQFAMSAQTREQVDTFWELIDEILNAVLFVLIGLEILILTVTGQYVLAAVLAIPVVLIARFISVGIPMSLLRTMQSFTPHAIKIMTWGGLRGGISVALALSLPPSPTRDLLLTMTYAVVIFSIVIQGLTIPRLLRRAVAEQPEAPEPASTHV
ncbi:cation:proton antiporter [Candidatus Entotheonella palauensis]|uniref:cation:proton antiporter n=1 Tax=Candidatus Entotheonella palauensis TaxID=93172 RepID=UPI000B7ECD02|nr:sodium:proton antiporter [Candidatus Entotheonella palauensis]